MKRIFFLIVTNVIAFNTMAQQHDLLSLKIGEKVPDLSFKIHKGDSVYSKHLSDFKGKLLILDRWATTCTTCIVAMPEVLAIQQRFKDKLQVLYVTSDSDDKIKTMWKKEKSWSPRIVKAGHQSPMVTDDTTTMKTHQLGVKIWIDENQILRAVSLDEISVKSVQAFLDSNKTIFSSYNSPDKNVDKYNWFANRIGYQDHLISYSILTKYDEKFRGSGQSVFERDSITKKVVGIHAINLSIVQLYGLAYQNYGLQNGEIVLEAGDSSKYMLRAELGYVWIKTNEFCYSMKVPVSGEANFFNLMASDLDKFFNIESKVEKRPMKCWILKRISNADHIKTKGGEPFDNKIANSDDNYTLTMHNAPVSQFLSTIESEYIPPYLCPFTPFFDETGYVDNIDIDIVCRKRTDSDSIPALRKSLQQLGLDLVNEERTIDVLVLQEKNRIN